MRGHTNNRVLASCLSALVRKAKAEIVRRPADEQEYFQGQIDALKETAILMDIEIKEN